MKSLRWAAFLPLGLALIVLAQAATVTVAVRLDWWISAPLIVFFGVFIAGAGAVPTMIAPEPKIGAAILLTIFLLLEAYALVGSFSATYPMIMRLYADVVIVVGAIAGVYLGRERLK